ncbi:MAG: TauD/TfdA family dioxygenase [Pseudomonadota bacterium]|nr:TauD/TfdA family dioxygenase [Pseudomonadota bacterium]
MSPIELENLHKDFGLKVTGIELNDSLSQDKILQIKEWIDDYSLVVFPRQHLNDEAHLEFTRKLGEPEPNHVSLGRDGVVNYFGTIGNVQPDGTVNGNSHKQTRFLTGNNMWHSDSSFRKVPSFVSIMSVYEVPKQGGETEYVSARAAYSRLSDETRKLIEPLEVIHDYVFSRSKVAEVDPAHAASLPPINQKLVRKNPNNNLKNYYVGSHARSIAGWTEKAGRELLDGLLAKATKSEHIYTQNWRSGDLVIWDNRCLLHRGTGYDADKYRRLMRQTRVCGSGPTLAE